MDDCIIDEDNSQVLKELIEDFVENLNKHRSVFDELCLNPFYTYISGKFRMHTSIAYGIILLFLVVNVFTLLVAWDVRTAVLRARK